MSDVRSYGIWQFTSPTLSKQCPDNRCQEYACEGVEVNGCAGFRYFFCILNPAKIGLVSSARLLPSPRTSCGSDWPWTWFSTTCVFSQAVLVEIVGTGGSDLTLDLDPYNVIYCPLYGRARFFFCFAFFFSLQVLYTRMNWILCIFDIATHKTESIRTRW